ncbi:MAG: UDP-N-acetylmuramoyl-L-alanine--D-glutamate ligase [Candidatus Peribacteraceae bacterium]|nr:UDP-N-acetylmuramoyl-L-alanine--D-glutamate ligase [Candidatus Peribacteraceae bacterium]
MNIRDLNGKSVAILGAHGREGVAMQKALKQFAPDAKISLRDMQDGDGYLDNLDQFDVLIKAPGIPPHLITNTGDAHVTNSTQIFLDSIDPQTTVIGVTGSKGKSTTASLIYAILKEAGKEAILLGNIGKPAISYLSQHSALSTQHFVVLELSSYQLMQVTSSPHIAVVTSFFPEHLDYHGSLENYKEAKKHVTKFQSSDDIVFYYKESDGAKEIANESAGSKVSYTEEDSLIAIIDTNLVGAHNLFNIAGSAAVARHLGIDDKTIVEAVRKFEGLPHRLKNLGKHHDIIWIDDAISTTPESTIAAIHSLTPNIKTIILGGQDRGNDFAQLGEVLAASGIEHVILMGESGPRIKEAITAPEIIIHEASSMEEAVSIAKTELKIASDSFPIALLSPASPSYGMFKDFEEKGDVFKKCIENHA